MPVAETSRWAFETLDLPDRQKQVLAAIFDLGEATDQEIATHLCWPINCVTPRRGELVEALLVVRARVKQGPTGRMTSVWRPADQQIALPFLSPANEERP